MRLRGGVYAARVAVGVVVRGVRGAIGARDGGVDGGGDVEETDALRQLHCGGDGGVGLGDAVEGGGEAEEERERLAGAGVDEDRVRGALPGGTEEDFAEAGVAGMWFLGFDTC